MKNNTDKIYKKVSDSKTIFTHATLPTDLNEGGTVYGARLLEWADNLSGAVAIRHRRGGVTTASFDNFDFIKPIRLGDIIHGEAYISGVGKKSMEIFVKFISEDSLSGEKYLASMGFITYAALNLKEGEEVAGIIGESQEEIEIIEGYEERKAIIVEKLNRVGKLKSIIDFDF
ncbi:MAG: acyl-CoA thioesterase [Peptoniphilaceae bacterium]